MPKKKCSQCGLVNAVTDDTCRRCDTTLIEGPGEAEPTVETETAGEEPVKKRTLGKRLLWILGATVFLFFAFYMSLRVTSQDLGYDQRQTVARSVAILQQKGFSREATVLSTFTTYRSTDNWWNKYVGHHDAYAATNFPFEVLTLYPEFFAHSADDDERAVILMHEAQHLFGAGEEAALEHVWRNKQRLGWTEEKYGQTRVWINTKELTMSLVPELFKCGPEGNSDCVP